MFSLLTDLCDSTKGHRAVTSAEECPDCIAHAAHVIGALVEEEKQETTVSNKLQEENNPEGDGDQQWYEEDGGEIEIEEDGGDKYDTKQPDQKGSKPESPVTIPSGQPKYSRKNQSLESNLEIYAHISLRSNINHYNREVIYFCDPITTFFFVFSHYKITISGKELNKKVDEKNKIKNI